jgi:tetratricopeptide (TPR) repeat protein
MQRFAGAALFLVVSSFSGCATFRGAGVASNTGWRRVTTPHFVLRTDFDDELAREAAQKLESSRDDLVSAAWPSFQFPEGVRTEVFVLSNGLDFERLFGRKADALFSSAGDRPRFYLYGPPSHWDSRESLAAESTSVVRHEMSHQLAAAVYSHEPLWFAEGLAQFLETVHESDDHKSVVVGAVNVEALRKYKTFRTVSVRTVLSWTERISTLSDGENHGLYGMSWMLVHFLYNTRPDAFGRFQIELAKGTDSARAWDTAFPNVDLDALDTEIQNYSKRGEYVEFPLPLHSKPVTNAAQVMTPAEAHLARVALYQAAARFVRPEDREARRAAAKSELAAALELDPTNVEALELGDGAAPADRLASARRAAAAHPDDPRAFRLLGSLLKGSGAEAAERESAYRHAVELDPSDPQSLNNLAWLLVEQHKAMEALPLALRAVKRAPYDAAILDTYAVALFQAGRCPSAIAYERRALELQRDSKETSLSTDLKRHLSEFKASCSAKTTTEAGETRN